MADIYDIQRETRDNLGSQDENKNLVLFGPFSETIGIEEGPTQLKTRNIGTAFILGHATNAILGTSALGIGTMSSWIINKVVNPNNIFHEHFRFSDFNDTTNSTGTFSTTYFNFSMDNGEVFQTLQVFDNTQSIQYVTIYVDLTGAKSKVAVSSGGGQIVNLVEGQ